MLDHPLRPPCFLFPAFPAREEEKLKVPGKQLHLSRVGNYRWRRRNDFLCVKLSPFPPDLLLSDTGLYTCQVRSSKGQVRNSPKNENKSFPDLIGILLYMQAVMSAFLSVLEDGDGESLPSSPQPSLSEVPGSPSRPTLFNATSNSVEVRYWRLFRAKKKQYQSEFVSQFQMG